MKTHLRSVALSILVLALVYIASGRIASMAGLTMLGETGDVASMADALGTSPDALIRVRAAEALKRYVSNPDVRAALIAALLHDPDAVVGSVALGALVPYADAPDVSAALERTVAESRTA